MHHLKYTKPRLYKEFTLSSTYNGSAFVLTLTTLLFNGVN